MESAGELSIDTDAAWCNLHRLESRLMEKEEEIEQLHSQIADLTAVNGRLEHKVENALSHIARLEEQIRRLANSVCRMHREMEKRDKLHEEMVVRSLLRRKREKRAMVRGIGAIVISGIGFLLVKELFSSQE